MLQALVLRTRKTPAATRIGDLLALQTWRGAASKRHNSTAQDMRLWSESEQTAAMLHGHVPKRDLKKSKLAPTSQSRQPLQVPTPLVKRSHVKKALQKSEPPGGQSRPDMRGKRKAKEHPNQRPAQKLRGLPQHTSLALKDEAYIRSMLHVPTARDYPDAPKDFFKNTKEARDNTFEGVATLRFSGISLGKNAHQCTLHYSSNDRNEIVRGEGTTKDSAENAAYLHLLAKLHEQGVLEETFDRISDLNAIGKRTSQERSSERDGIIDIYDYAARFDTVPEIRREIVHYKKSRSKKKKAIQVTLELTEQEISVKALGHDMLEAEINATAKFKQKAEIYHAKHNSEAMIIKDSSALTTDSASKFFEFYKIIHPGVQIQPEITLATGSNIPGTPLYRAQVKINDEPRGKGVVMGDKRKAEKAAFLTAAIDLKAREPALYPRFLHALQSGNGNILRPVPPIDMPVDDDCSIVMRQTLLEARKAGLSDEIEAMAPEAESDERTRGAMYPFPLQGDLAKRKNWVLQQRLNIYRQNPDFADTRRKMAEMPMNQHAQQVLQLVNNNLYSIIVGSTGSGKTTQVPQIILEDAINNAQGGLCNIVCTQPRRIAAVSVARRVADLRGEQLGSVVGYHVRFDPKLPEVGGSITYCTTGILLQQLQHMPDKVLDTVSHLIIDEVHERDMFIDFLLILLKKVLMGRKAQGKSVPHVVLMSATMNTELFASYFRSDNAEAATPGCPSLTVPGRTFPVRERYLDEILKDMTASSPSSQLAAMREDVSSKDYLDAEDAFRLSNPLSDSLDDSNSSRDGVAVIDWKKERIVSADGETSVSSEKEDALVPYGLVACVINHIAKTSQEGAILVFLPGLAEIVKVNQMLNQYESFKAKDETKYKVFLLHSSIAASQVSVFDPLPEGCRKIILATNIAETSVTIPDVQYVVDTGKLREKQYDQSRRMSSLACTWISKSNAKQRAGRAGRVQNGNYYALYTRQRYESLRPIGLPEILRSDLQETCLSIKAQAFKTPIREFLAEAIEPPPAQSVDTSVTNLQALDALTEDEAITPLGRLLSSLPVHPTLGKMIVLGVIFRCLDAMLILGSASSERNLFTQPLGARREAKDAKLSFVEGSGSDHLAVINAVRELRTMVYERGERAMRDFAMSNFLHLGVFRVIDSTAKQIEQALVEAGLIPYTPVNDRSSHNYQYGHPSLNQNSHKVPLIKALILAGSHPNLAVNIGGAAFRTPGEKATIVHPASINASRDNKDKSKDSSLPKYGTLHSYGSLTRSSDGATIFLRDTTETTPLMATLFGGRLRQNEERWNILEVDHWLPFFVKSRNRHMAKLIVEFRKALDRLLATAFNDLGALSRQRRNTKIGSGNNNNSRTVGGEQPRYLADEKVRELFAEGLVEVLDRDIRLRESVATRGWGPHKSWGGVDQDSRNNVSKFARSMAAGG